MHGQFVWYELTTPDVDAAVEFYPRFTGWGTQRFDADYMMWTTGGVPFAGLFRLGPEMLERGIPPNWMPYVETDDVDAAAVKAKSLGGSLMHGPDDIPGTGRFAVIQDPQGAVFGIYKSNRKSGAWEGNPVVGRFSWHELMAADHATAFEFYRALFGWERMQEMDMGGGLMYLVFGQGGKMYGGMYTRFAHLAGMHPFWLCYVHVKDVGDAVAIATKAGAMVHRAQMDIPGGSIAILGDPQGAAFALHHVNRTPEVQTSAARKTGARKPAAKKVSAKKVAARKPAAKKAARVKSRRAAAATRAATRPRKASAGRKAKPGARGKSKRRASGASGSRSRARSKGVRRASARKKR